MSNLKSEIVEGTIPPSKRPTFEKYGKKHHGNCLVRMDNFFGCGKSGHKVRDCPNLMRKEMKRESSS